MKTTVDFINLSPSVHLDGDAPNRVLIEKDFSYSHFRVFSCRCFVHIPRDESFNLDVKSKECVFMSYGHQEFSYE